MKLQLSQRWVAVILAGAGVALIALAIPPQVWAHGPAEGGASNNDINRLFRIVLWIAIPVFLLVEGLIVFSIFRYRRRSEDEMPEQVEGNTSLEISWTVLSFVIVGVLFLLTVRALQTDYEIVSDNEAGTPDLTVRVTGYQFNWDYEYVIGDSEETGVITTETMTIPAARNVLLEITSDDVQHSFWVPDLAGKVDAIPGYVNTMWLTVDEPGRYDGNCAEYCGTAHYDMEIAVEVLEPTAFDAWLGERMARQGQPVGTDLESPLPSGDVARGEEVFLSLGCDSCHGTEDGVGPALTGLGDRARARAGEMDDMTPEYYLREAILLPCEYETPGYNCQVMPNNYGERLDPQQLADLIAYLLAN